MASSINASTASGGGIVQTADASGILQLQTAGITAVTVDASQNMGVGTTSTLGNSLLNVAQGVVVRNVGATTGYFQTYNSNAGADLKTWRLGGDSSGNALLQTVNDAYSSATERFRISNIGYMTNSVNGNSQGLVQALQYYRLDSGYVGANATGAQSLFGVGVTLVGSTVYEFEGLVMLNKTAGTTSHQILMSVQGTATLNNIMISYIEGSSSAGTAVSPPSSASIVSTLSAGAVTVASAISTATRNEVIKIKGTVSVNAGGTFIPSYQLSAAPGGAYTTQPGSYFKISPLGASGSNINIGSWA